MGKGSGMLARMKAQHQAELLAQKMVTKQETADFFLMAAHFEFGFGPKRLARLMDRVNHMMNSEYDVSDADTKDNDYTRDKHEELMQQICKNYYVPREERYKYD